MKARPDDGTQRTPGVRLERSGAIATLTLARPDRHNALGSNEVSALTWYLDQIEGDEEVRVLVLTGEGRTFCAGASLDEMESGAMDGDRFETLTDRLSRLDRPVVCALNGSVYGGGAELALCCDFRVGSRGMELAVPAARLGVCYPPGGVGRYARRLGSGASARILLSAEVLDADELYRIGYLTHLVPPESFRAEVRSLAERLAALAPLAVRGMKELLRDAACGALDREGAKLLVERCSRSRDLAEGLAARREGRPPDFRGR